jgi:hypothetical protein
MASFRERIGKLTVGEALILNEASKIIAKYKEENK